MEDGHSGVAGNAVVGRNEGSAPALLVVVVHLKHVVGEGGTELEGLLGLVGLQGLGLDDLELADLQPRKISVLALETGHGGARGRGGGHTSTAQRGSVQMERANTK